MCALGRTPVEKNLAAAGALVGDGVDVRAVGRAALALIVGGELAIDELALDELAAGEIGAAKHALHEARLDEQAFLELPPVPMEPREGAADEYRVDVPALDGEARELAVAKDVPLQDLGRRPLLPVLGPLDQHQMLVST